MTFRTGWWFVLAAFMVVAIAPISSQHAYSAPSVTVKRVTVALNKSRQIKLDQAFGEVVIGNPEIADARPLTDHSVYVLGKAIGTTNLSIYNNDKYLVGIVDIEVSYDIKGLRSKLRKTPGARGIKVSAVNGRIMLSGSAPDVPVMEKAMSIASQYAASDKVINSVSVGSSQQVMLEVRFVEAFHTAGRELGLRWDVLSKRFAGIIGGAGASTAAGPLGTVAIASHLTSNDQPFGTMVGRLLNGGATADSIIQALETQGLARRLAEPNLVALSGDSASFLAGGEFPFPVPGGDGTVTVKFKKYGVGLKFTPTVLSNGIINLRIEPEVSQLDTSNTLRIAGVEIPGLVVRRAKTTVELRDGQSFAIAGLLQTNHSKTGRGLPWANKVPVLGTLFSSRSYQKSQTDLVIIVTPRLVRPVPPGQMLATPLDKMAPSNDAEYFLTGKMETSRKMAQLAKSSGVKGPYGHMLGF